MRKCVCEGECFGRKIDGSCTVLTVPSKDCSFRKPERLVTNGRYYPYNPTGYTTSYERRNREEIEG